MINFFNFFCCTFSFCVPNTFVQCEMIWHSQTHTHWHIPAHSVHKFIIRNTLCMHSKQNERTRVYLICNVHKMIIANAHKSLWLLRFHGSGYNTRRTLRRGLSLSFTLTLWLALLPVWIVCASSVYRCHANSTKTLMKTIKR